MECRGVEPGELSDSEAEEGFTEARNWICPVDEAASALAQTRLTLVRLLLGRTEWRLETFSREKRDEAHECFERVMGERVKFAGEVPKNLMEKLDSSLLFDERLVPPRLVQDAAKISSEIVAKIEFTPSLGPEVSESIRGRDVNFLGEKLFMLDGKTPREAAADPLLRPRLINIVKECIADCDRENLRYGEEKDINWMVQELGLTEILFDPPPSRPMVIDYERTE